ncbi:MAG: CHAD domain-containing protein [Nitrospirales bacterium]
MNSPVQETVEREIKLRVKRNFALPPLPGVPLSPRLFTSLYYDTEDFRLAKAGITLRYRLEARKGAWQLKIPRDPARLEVEFSGSRTSPPDSLTKLLFAFLRGQSLKPIARLRTRRTRFQVSGDESPVAEVVMDSVAALKEGRVIRRLYELEVELKGGTEKDLAHLQTVLQAAGAQEEDRRPKVFQVLELELPAPVAMPSPTAPPIAHLKTMLGIQVRQLLGHDPGTRLGTDEEDLHQMRVATRRLRAYLRAARPLLLSDWSEPLRAELAWLGSLLGPVRDLEVLLGHLTEEDANLPLPEHHALGRILQVLKRERAEARASLIQGLESDRYLTLLDRVAEATQSPVATETPVTLRDLARSEWMKLLRAMRKGGPNPSDEVLHQIRITCKRARYAAELAEASVGKAASRFIRQTKVFQNLLGENQDALVAEQRLRNLLGQKHGTLTTFTLGRLIERQCERRRTAQASIPKAWTKLKKQAKRLGPDKGPR